ncbi:MAG: hypothetical protein WCV41_02765 [Patescibacteria group bacterium]
MNINLANFYGLLHLKAKETKIGLGVLWHNAGLRTLLSVSLLINVINWGIGYFVNYRATEEVISLHNNIYFGITLIGAPSQVYFLPFFGLVVIAVNAFFSYLIKEDDRFFLYVFSVSSVLVNVFLILGLAAIALLNF